VKVPITRPYIGEEEKNAVAEVLDSGWLVQGIRVDEFEEMVGQYVGTKFAKACTSCTTALHLALMALGIGKGDEVILPSFTYVASANAIEYTGATPMFVDIDLATFNMDVNKIEECIERSCGSVRVLMPVHLFGLCADMDVVMELATKYRLHVVEDAACAMGSLYKSQHAGTFGVGCFSYHARKPITTGEGGMITTDDEQIAMKVQSLRDHGAAVSDLARHGKGGYVLPAFEVCGYNYRLTDIQGSIGVEQMKKLPWILKRRAERAKRYDEALRNIEWLKIPYVPHGYTHTYQSYVTLIRNPKSKKIDLNEVTNLNKFRNKIMAELEEKGIATRQGTHAVHTLGYYKRKYGIKETDYPNSFIADRLSMTLPLYPQMTDDEQEYVIEKIKDIKFHI